VTVAPKLAGTIRIEDRRILIDGQELPWYVAESSISVDLNSRGDLDQVTLTLYAEHVEVDHATPPRRPSDDDEAGTVTVFDAPRDPDLPSTTT
jgi:hypothetical protein